VVVWQPGGLVCARQHLRFMQLGSMIAVWRTSQLQLGR
jgi:hypothetical protein